MSIELIRKIKDLVIGGTNDEGWVYDKATTDSKLATKPTATLVTDINNSSTDTQVASAKAINTKLNNKSDSNHNHNSEYYTQQQVDDKIDEVVLASQSGTIDLSGYASKDHSHGNITKEGLLTVSNGIVTTDANKKVTSVSTITKSKISDFSHAHGNLTNDGKLGSAANLPVITGANGVITTGSFGTAANTFCQGNDSRLSNARTPTSHTHGNITNTGAIGTAANLPIITTTDGKLTTSSFGTGANTFCEGNDTRLSDARTPKSHTHGNITNAGAIGSTANLPIITGTNGVLKAGSFETTATNIKMNGTQSAGSLNTFARGDHVHPVDTSRAPNNHASTATTYGVASSSAYGHVKLDSSPTMNSSNVVSSGGMYTFLKWKTLNWGESGNASWGLSLYYNDSFVALSLDTGSDFSTSIGSSWVTIGYTVPEGYRPSHHTSGHIYPNLELYVGSDGAIKVRKISGDATTAAKGYVIYPRF